MGHAHRYAFTLVELLVVIGIVAVVVGLLLPTLSGVRRAGRTAECLSNMRQMELAQIMYANANRNYLVRAGLDHGSAHVREVAWINTLERYYEDDLLHRCPSDQSIHWPGDDGTGGIPIPGSSPPAFRRTSYGINDYLDPHSAAFESGWARLTGIANPSATVQFVEMAEAGPFAGGDHPHVDNWHDPFDPDAAPRLAAGHLQTHRHGGDRGAWEARANYGFLDGSARTLPFRDVYESPQTNKFNPAIAR